MQNDRSMRAGGGGGEKGRSAVGSDSDRSVVKKVSRKSRIYRTDSEWLRVGTRCSVREVDKRETSDTSPHPILLLGSSPQSRLDGIESLGRRNYSYNY